jgi:hypothetical protein
MAARIAALGLALTLGGCGMFGPPGMRGAGGNPMMEMAREAIADRGRLKVFDQDKDGKVTLVELDQGLQASYALWDKDKNGSWNSSEARAANEALTLEDPGMPPVRDWDQSGGVSFEEYAAWNRGRFRRGDANQDGAVDPDEFTAMPKMPPRPPGGMPPGGMPPGGKPPGGKPPGGGMPGGR